MNKEDLIINENKKWFVSHKEHTVTGGDNSFYCVDCEEVFICGKPGEWQLK